MSMFEFPWDHPNFMPTTRDLSPDKTEIVRRWIECEVYGPQHLKDSGSSLKLVMISKLLYKNLIVFL